MEHKCPWCGGDLPENASFCPHCAQFTRPRKEAATPIPLRKKALLGLLLLAVLAAVGAGLWLSLSPKSYDGYGEVRYRDYQLLLSQFSDRYVPSPTVSVQGEPEGQYRMPARLFINNSDGQDASQAFLGRSGDGVGGLCGPGGQPLPHDVLPARLQSRRTGVSPHFPH